MTASLEGEIYCSELAIRRSPFRFAFLKKVLELLLSWKNVFSRSCLTENSPAFGHRSKIKTFAKNRFFLGWIVEKSKVW